MSKFNLPLEGAERADFINHIRQMQENILALQEKLPMKESYAGSNLQQLDMLVNKVLWEYAPLIPKDKS